MVQNYRITVEPVSRGTTCENRGVATKSTFLGGGDLSAYHPDPSGPLTTVVVASDTQIKGLKSYISLLAAKTATTAIETGVNSALQ